MTLSTSNIILLIVGLAFLALDVAPMVSRKVFNWFNERFWEDKNPAWSERGSYMFNRYWRHIEGVGIGLTLIGYALYRIFFT